MIVPVVFQVFSVPPCLNVLDIVTLQVYHQCLQNNKRKYSGTSKLLTDLGPAIFFCIERVSYLSSIRHQNVSFIQVFFHCVIWSVHYWWAGVSQPLWATGNIIYMWDRPGSKYYGQVVNVSKYAKPSNTHEQPSKTTEAWETNLSTRRGRRTELPLGSGIAGFPLFLRISRTPC